MNIFELVTSSNMVAYWTNLDLNNVTVGDQLFPYKKEIGLRLDYIKGANNQVVGLKLSAFDSKSIRRDRQGIERVETEMPFFKESMVIDEKLRQDLNTLIQTQNKEMVYAIVRRIFDDELRLIKAAYETVERVRMQMLTTGTITLASNGQAYTYDYGMPNANKITVQTSWSSSSSDPIGDIIAVQDLARSKGFEITRAMCNTACLNDLINNSSIKNRLYVLAQGNVTITRDEVRRYIERETGIAIYINDNGYVAENGTFTKYFADDVFVLFPDGPLGYTHYGTTPEESDLMTGATKAEVALVNGAVAVTTVKEEDPVNVMTKVSMVMLPSFEQVEKVFVLDTTAN